MKPTWRPWPTFKRRPERRPSPTHAARSHLQVVNEPLVVELPLFRVHRLRVDGNLSVVLGVHLYPAKGGGVTEANLYWMRHNAKFYKLQTHQETCKSKLIMLFFEIHYKFYKTKLLYGHFGLNTCVNIFRYSGSKKVPSSTSSAWTS